MIAIFIQEVNRILQQQTKDNSKKTLSKQMSIR